MLTPIDSVAPYYAPARFHHLVVLDRLNRLASSERDDWPVSDSILGHLGTEDERDVAETITVDGLTHLENIWFPGTVRRAVGEQIIKCLKQISRKLLIIDNQQQLDLSIDGLYGYCTNSFEFQRSSRRPVKPYEHILAYIASKTTPQHERWRFHGQLWREVYNPENNDRLNHLAESLVVDYIHDSIVGVLIPRPVRPRVRNELIAHLNQLVLLGINWTPNRHKLEETSGWIDFHAASTLQLPP